jgi:hypothetical protein
MQYCLVFLLWGGQYLSLCVYVCFCFIWFLSKLFHGCGARLRGNNVVRLCLDLVGLNHHHCGVVNVFHRCVDYLDAGLVARIVALD